MSKTTVVYPIVACLKEAVIFLKSKGTWSSTNNKQAELLEKCYTKDIDDLENIQDILESMSSKDHEELMKFFKDRGFEFNIEPFNSNEFGVGSVLSVLVEWLDVHKKYDIHVENKIYQGVRAKENYKVYKFI